MKLDRMKCAVGLCGVLLAVLPTTVVAQTKAPARSASAIKVHTVAVITDPALDAPARHGLTKLEETLRAQGIMVSEDAGAISSSDFAIVAGVMAARGPAAVAIGQMKATVPEGAEVLTVRTGATYRGKPAIVLAGSDASGLMYAELDLADRVGWAAKGANPFQFARSVSE